MEGANRESPHLAFGHPLPGERRVSAPNEANRGEEVKTIESEETVDVGAKFGGGPVGEGCQAKPLRTEGTQRAGEQWIR